MARVKISPTSYYPGCPGMYARPLAIDTDGTIWMIVMTELSQIYAIVDFADAVVGPFPTHFMQEG
jgi:hypothetical protein